MTPACDTVPTHAPDAARSQTSIAIDLACRDLTWIDSHADRLHRTDRCASGFGDPKHGIVSGWTSPTMKHCVDAAGCLVTLRFRVNGLAVVIDALRCKFLCRLKGSPVAITVGPCIAPFRRAMVSQCRERASRRIFGARLSVRSRSQGYRERSACLRRCKDKCRLRFAVRSSGLGFPSVPIQTEFVFFVRAWDRLCVHRKRRWSCHLFAPLSESAEKRKDGFRARRFPHRTGAAAWQAVSSSLNAVFADEGIEPAPKARATMTRTRIETGWGRKERVCDGVNDDVRHIDGADCRWSYVQPDLSVWSKATRRRWRLRSRLHLSVVVASLKRR